MTVLAGEVARVDPPGKLARVALVLFPVLAALGPIASVAPARSGFPYFYRVLALVALPGAVVSVYRLRADGIRAILPFSLLTLTWLVWAPLTLWWSPDRQTGLSEVLAGAIACLAAWVLLVLTRGDRYRIAFVRSGWALVLFPATAIVVGELVTHKHLFSELTGSHWIFVNAWVGGFRHNPNDFAAICAACYVALLALLMRRRRLWEMAAISVGALVVLPYILVATNSRAALLTVVTIGLLSLPWFIARPGWRARVALVIASVAISIMVTGVVPGSGVAIRSWIAESARPPQVATQTETSARPGQIVLDAAEEARQEAVADSQRIMLSRTGLRYFESAPVIGHGAGSFGYLWAHDAEAAYKWPMSLHNSYLQFAIHYGALGLLPLLYLILVVLWRAVPRRVSDLRDPMRFESLGFLVAAVVMSVTASSALGDPAHWLMLAYSGALAWGLGRVRLRSRLPRPRLAPLRPRDGA